MKKMLLLLLVVALFAVVAVGCGGSDVPAPVEVPAAEPPADVVDENAGDSVFNDESDLNIDIGDIVLPGDGEGFEPGALIPAFLFVTGDVTSIEEIDGQTYVRVEDTDGNPVDFVISDETIFPFSERYSIGDTVTGWYSTEGIMPMIWPPVHNITVLAIDAPDGVNIKVDRFHKWEDNADGYMISQDEMFAFVVDEDTEIILEDGQDFSDFDFELNRKMIVIYGISTRSIPEMATADKLIVLFEAVRPLS